MVRKLIHYFVFSNIHISLAAALFIVSSFFISGNSINWFYISFITCGTFIIYNIHRYIALKSIEPSQRSKRHLVFDKNIDLFSILILLFTVVAAISFYLLPRDYQKLLVVPMIISLAYVIPSIDNKRIRDLPYVKIILIAVVWAWFYAIPFSKLDQSVGLLFIEKFLFIFGLTVPFDNRDREVDFQSGLKTIANSMSPNVAIRLSIILILLSSFLGILLFIMGFYTIITLSFLLFCNLISVLLISKSIDKDDFYFLAYLDGMILLQGIFISLSIFITI